MYVVFSYMYQLNTGGWGTRQTAGIHVYIYVFTSVYICMYVFMYIDVYLYIYMYVYYKSIVL